MTYIAAEPAKVEAYLDQNGDYHPNRDAAIQRNFYIDLERAALDVTLANLSPRAVAQMLKDFVLKHPDMVRVMLGDRDAT